LNVHAAAPGCSRYTALLRRAGVACCHPWPGGEQSESGERRNRERAEKQSGSRRKRMSRRMSGKYRARAEEQSGSRRKRMSRSRRMRMSGKKRVREQRESGKTERK
jgi:hypothetical protein